jgi:hypothetical protein
MSDWQNWVDRHIDKITKKYSIKCYSSDSYFRDDAIIFTEIEGKEVDDVGTDHVDCNPGQFKVVENFLERIKKENPHWD